uniref:AB hydrolase-1 domain-containing protein n=1 Tax=Araucaria cunninghamii TaxID=56994 RepID=A0A0D6QZG3_ARACU
MGNQLVCFQRKPKRSASTRSAAGHDRWGKGRAPSRKDDMKQELLQQQALAYVLSQQQNGHLSFERSSSQRHTGPAPKQGLPRSASARPRSSQDPVLQPVQLINQDAKLADLETNHFVLVHGGGFGAWCWYKTIALLEEAGFKTTAIDLTGSGIDSTDPNKITSLAQYVKPLTEFFEKLGNDEKVILVGHDFGGACISYAMEDFPLKIAKAVFVSAAMVTNGQRAFDIFSQEVLEQDTLLHRAQKFKYANGSASPPTAIEFDKELLRDVLFNHSPAKDIALASVSMRPVPFAPVLEKLSLTDKNYGSVRRFFIETSDDQAITGAIQENLIKSNPPEQVFRVKGSDHSPFFSKPQALHKLFLEIAQLGPKKGS